MAKIRKKAPSLKKKARKKVKKKKGWTVYPSHLGACVKLTGRLNDGILLYRILSRSQKKTMKDEYDEEGWIVLSRIEWMADTGLTRHQYDDALRRLKERGYIEFRHRKKSYKDKNATAWFRISEDTISAVEEIMTPKIDSGVKDSGKEVDSDSAEAKVRLNSGRADALIRNNKTINNKTIKFSLKKNVRSDEDKNGRSVGEGKNTKYESILDEIYKGVKFAPEPASKGNVEKLKKIIRYLEKRIIHFPDNLDTNRGKAITALNYIIQDWEEFSCFTKNHANAVSVPNSPKLWFINAQQPCIVDYFTEMQERRETEEDPYRSRSGRRLDIPKLVFSSAEDKSAPI